MVWEIKTILEGSLKGRSNWNSFEFKTHNLSTKNFIQTPIDFKSHLQGQLSCWWNIPLLFNMFLKSSTPSSGRYRQTQNGRPPLNQIISTSIVHTTIMTVDCPWLCKIYWRRTRNHWKVYFMRRRLLELDKRVIALSSIVTHFGFRNPARGRSSPFVVLATVKTLLLLLHCLEMARYTIQLKELIRGATVSVSESPHNKTLSIETHKVTAERRQFPQNYISKCKFNLLFHQVPFLIYSPYPVFHATASALSAGPPTNDDVNFNCNKWPDYSVTHPPADEPPIKWSTLSVLLAATLAAGYFDQFIYTHLRNRFPPWMALSARIYFKIHVLCYVAITPSTFHFTNNLHGSFTNCIQLPKLVGIFPGWRRI